MKKKSAGILMYKKKEGKLMVFLAHPGGPFYKNKDLGSWDIPKGELKEGEEELIGALREFKEETGIKLEKDKEDFIDLGEVKRKDGKIVKVFAVEGDWTGLLMGKSFVTLEYPLKSGKMIKFPEIDKASFFDIETAKTKIRSYLNEFLLRLADKLR